MVSPVVSDEAVMFPPGGGKLGTLLGGAFDGLLADVAARQLPTGRLVEHTVNAPESAMSGLAEGTAVEFLGVPAELFPANTWQLLLDRAPLALIASLRDGEVTDMVVQSTENARSCPSPEPCHLPMCLPRVATARYPRTRKFPG